MSLISIDSDRNTKISNKNTRRSSTI
jgi:hypothetical protein